LLFGGNGQGGQAGGGADVAKQGKNVLPNELAGILGAAVGLIAVVHGQQFNGPAVNAAARIGLLKIHFGTRVELDAQLRCCAGEGC
jgi:hypothetical protein